MAFTPPDMLYRGYPQNLLMSIFDIHTMHTSKLSPSRDNDAQPFWSATTSILVRTRSSVQILPSPLLVPMCRVAHSVFMRWFSLSSFARVF